MTLSTSVLRQPDQLLSIKSQWDALHAECVNRSFYNSFWFVYNSHKHFPNPEDELFVLLVKDKDSLVGIFFFERHMDKQELINLRTVEFSCLEETDKPYPVIHPTYHKAAWIAALTHLKSEMKCHVVTLIEQTSRDLRLLKDISSSIRGICIASPFKQGPIIHLSQSWDEFEKKHKKMRKRFSRFSRDYEGRFRFELKQGNALLTDYLATEAKSWKHKKIGFNQSERHRNFYDSLLANLNKENVVMGILYVDDQPISAELAYVEANTLYLAQGCYDNEFSDYSPGMISTALLLKAFMGHPKVDRADCLCGFAQYLESWSDDVVQTNKVNIYTLSPRTLLYLSLRLLKKLGKPLLR